MYLQFDLQVTLKQFVGCEIVKGLKILKIGNFDPNLGSQNDTNYNNIIYDNIS